MAATAAEQNELKRVKQEVADFKAKLMSIYREHLTLIGVLEGESVTEDENKVDSLEENSDSIADVTAPTIHNMPDFTDLEIIDEE